MPFPPKRDLANHAAIVTGASSGFGLILSQRLAARGVRVLMADINPAGEKEAASLNAKFGDGTAVFLSTDVSKSEAVEKMFQVRRDLNFWTPESRALILV
jgi:NAD(P)-dependent dehydrogenase (short-subunit alcohol dehydrogenase family)